MVVLNKRSKGGKGVESVDDEELYNDIMDEISSGDIQSTMDKLLENQSFDFGDFVGKTINSGKGIDFNNILKQIADGIVSNLNDEKSLYTNIILIALSGAVITNFSKLLQGKRVAQMGFYTIYVLFFSVLSVSFMRTSTIAEETLTKIFDFMKVLAPTYFTCLSFTKGAGLGTGYYQITLLMLTVADFILLKFVLPGVKIYFWLRIVVRGGNVFKDGRVCKRYIEFFYENDVSRVNGGKCRAGNDCTAGSRGKKFRTGKGWQHGAGNRQYDKQCGEFGASGRKSCKKCSRCGWGSCAYYHMCNAANQAVGIGVCI